jgi:putative DNA primase/helicase
MEAAKVQREAEQVIIHEECREASAKLWQEAAPAPNNHQYLTQKQVKPNGLKLHKNALVVPVRDTNGVLHGLQFITPENKRFKSGTNKKAHYYAIGGKPRTVLYLAEGYATAATIFEVTGEPVAVCFDAGNLLPVAEALRAKMPTVQLILCADNDRNTEGNPGLTKATAAAIAVNGLVAVPDFKESATGTDFNDMAAQLGADEVLAQLRQASKPEEDISKQTLATLAGLAEDNEPLPLRRILPKPDDFPVESLPPVLRAMVEEIIRVIQPPVALASQSVLAAASLAVQPLADVSIDGRQSPLSCFFVSVGASGERKSTVDNAVLAPHRKREHILIDIAKNEGIDYQASLETWKRDKEKATKEKGDIKQALLALGAEPEAPLGGQMITEEPTYEGIFKQLQYGLPSIGIFAAEGGRFIGGHAMGKDNQLKTATGLSSLWDGTPMTRTRSGDGSNTLYGRRCSLHLMLQPNIAGELFSNSLLIGQGLLSRCLVTYPGSTIGTRPYIESDISTSLAGRDYFSTMTSLLEMQLPLAEGQRNELKPRELYLSSEAKQEWITFHDHIEILMREGGDLSDIKGFAAKAAEHAARLAGVMALVEDPCTTAISHYTIQAGIELSQFYIGEALRLFHSANDDQELIIAERSLEWATSYGGSFSLPCLYQKGPNKVRDKKKAAAIIDILIQHNRIVPVEGGMVVGGRKRRDVWRVTL